MMPKSKEFRSCPSCGACVSVIQGKISRHERGLGYVPYRLYKGIEQRTGNSVKDQAKKNLCKMDIGLYPF